MHCFVMCVWLLARQLTTNSTMYAIGQLIKEFIANDVRKAGMFSVQLDTTQDITTQDQCSVILRYVTDTVHERLVALVRCPLGNTLSTCSPRSWSA